MILQEPDPLQIRSPYWKGLGVLKSSNAVLDQSISLVFTTVPSGLIAPLYIAIWPKVVLSGPLDG